MAVTKPNRIAGDERRELIALAAGRLFAVNGYADTRMEDVATAAQVTKPIVYRHFDSKKDLYLALLARHEDDLPTFFEESTSRLKSTPESRSFGRSSRRGWTT